MFERQAQNETKKQNHSLIERVQALQAELQDSEVRRNELEGQVRQSHTVSLLLTSKKGQLDVTAIIGTKVCTIPRYHNIDVNLTQYRSPISQSNSISDCISIYIDKHRPDFYILLDDTDGFLAIIHSELTLTSDVENSTKRVSNGIVSEKTNFVSFPTL